MSHALIVVGSRRNGNSLKLAKDLKAELSKSRIISTIIVPGNQKIYLCTGCMDCDTNGICDFNDDMNKNINLINKNDAVIFISPTRWNTISGDLKIFMDRLNPLYTTKGLKNKKAIIIAIGGKQKEDFSTNGTIHAIDSFCESAEMEVIYKNQFNSCLFANDILKYKDKIKTMTSKIEKLLS